jgi:hypothetical protein
MFTSRHAVVISAASLLFAGCIGEPDEVPTGEATSALLSANLLSANLLSANLLSANLLSANSLTSSPLSTQKLSTLVQTALQDPALGANDRTLFHYIASCALDASQSVSYAWSDAAGTHPVTEQGQVGLAPEWASRSLNRDGQQLVSACVASRVNYFGVSVSVSLRNEVLAQETPKDELATYSHVEGAFWGNLFDAKPHLHSCYDPKNASHSLSAQRACATGYLDTATGELHSCGMIQLTGPCDQQLLDPRGQFYWAAGNDDTMNAITVGLQ